MTETEDDNSGVIRGDERRSMLEFDRNKTSSLPPQKQERQREGHE